MKCPVCGIKIKVEYCTGNFDHDVAVKLIAHVRHVHTDYEKCFPKEAKIAGLQTTGYLLIKQEYNKQAIDILLPRVKQLSIYNVLTEMLVYKESDGQKSIF